MDLDSRQAIIQESARDLFVGIEDPIVQESERFGTSHQIRVPETSTQGREKALEFSIRANSQVSQVLLVATFQGEDYNQALAKFRVSSKDTLQSVLKKLSEAKSFFSRSSGRYPPGIVKSLEDPYQVFRTYTRHSLGVLNEKVANQVRRFISREEFLDYDAKNSGYNRDQKEYQRRRAVWEQEAKESTNSGISSSDLFLLAAPLPPKPPIKPVGYDLTHPSSELDITSIRSRLNVALGRKSRTPYSSYLDLNNQMGTTMPLRNHLQKTALYHGIDPSKNGVNPYVGWEQAQVRSLGPDDFNTLLASANTWLKSPVLSQATEGMVSDSRFRAALDLAIRDTESGRYSSVVDSNLYNMLLAKLVSKDKTRTLPIIHQASNNIEGTEMTTKKEAASILSRLDRIAGVIQENCESWGMPFEAAKGIVNALDETADKIEKSAFGEDHFAQRQVNVLKQAKVIQQDSDEDYMGTFDAPSAPKQTDSDEAYMSLFQDDQTQAVAAGKSTTGRPLAP
jgi:hypothetical protein